MKQNRKSSGHVVGWMPAIIFNALLLMMPIFGVQIISTAFSGNTYTVQPTAETLAETRRVMDRAFSNMSPRGDKARAFWAAKVDRELEARNVSAARGFLLAAPQMLNREDARAIRAAANDEPSGTEDQRLLKAALLFLPNDVRVGFEESARPRGQELVSADADLTSESNTASAPFPGEAVAIASTTSTIDTMTKTPEFSVLGTVEDLVNRSRSWIRGNREKPIEFKLASLAMASDPSAMGVSNLRLIKAASVLKMAWRTERLSPQYRRVLGQRVHAALPDANLDPSLEDALSEVAPLRVRAERVRSGIAGSVDVRAAERLGPELDQIGQIAQTTSTRGALTLVRYSNTAADIRKARLIAQAGGDRAVALASEFGADALDMTGASVRWDRNLILQIMALAAAAIALFLTMLSAVLRMIFGRQITAIL